MFYRRFATSIKEFAAFSEFEKKRFWPASDALKEKGFVVQWMTARRASQAPTKLFRGAPIMSFKRLPHDKDILALLDSIFLCFHSQDSSIPMGFEIY